MNRAQKRLPILQETHWIVFSYVLHFLLRIVDFVAVIS